MLVNDNRVREFGKWNGAFSITCWILWRRRNEVVHQNVSSSVHEALAEIKGIVHCMSFSKMLQNPFSNTVLFQGRNYQDQSIQTKVYVDGAFSHCDNIAGCGGIMCNRQGELFQSFACSIQGRSSINAELWGCILGLRLSWEAGFRNILLFTDAQDILSLIEQHDISLHEENDTIMLLRELLHQDWEVSIRWISREENNAADFFARYALKHNEGLQTFTKDLSNALLADGGVI